MTKHLFRCFGGLRLSVALLSVLLIHISFVLSGSKDFWLTQDYLLITFTVFIITLARVTWNDFYERNHNPEKSKYIMNNNDRIFFSMILSLLWIAAVLLSYSRFSFSHHQSILLLVCIVIGIFLPSVRRFYFFSTILTAIANSLPILFAFNIDDIGAGKCIAFFVFVFCVVLGREILKDMEKRHKKEQITEKGLSESEIIRLVASFILVGLFACLFTLPKNNEYFFTITFSLGCFICFFVLVSFVYTERYRIIQKNFLDVGVCLILLSLAIVPLFTK